jgi:hypothetical protein
MILSKIKNLSELKEDQNDISILYQIATESGLYSLWLDDNSYRLLPNFLKYKYGIVVRQGYIICNNDFACRIVIEFTSVPYEKVFVMKGLF